ncbi:MAG: hypothetical protein CFH02_01465 [Alphaproteobacteria bacterium MarineAlpha3_Bin1]|nr:MAG: hypothetical protein CFH02_01465 [Alphaproteobacteria bacterium MarineAlpha3_Bin1]
MKAQIVLPVKNISRTLMTHKGFRLTGVRLYVLLTKPD